MNRAALLIASLAMSLTAGLAAAQDAAGDDEFLLSDTDGSGCISWEELRNRGVIVFDALDVNDDGMISADEHLEAVNANGEPVEPSSEAVDMSRFQVALRQTFDRADVNKDSCLDREEWDDG